MHRLFEEFITNANIGVLLLVVAISIAVLGVRADVLVDNAVKISIKTGLPKIIVGATIVSIGTTFPERWEVNRISLWVTPLDPLSVILG